MSEIAEFTFDDDSVAGAYDNGLVPVLFEPWATRLVEEHGPWEGRRVLDLATGTGIVAQKVAKEIGPGGKVVGADINPEMLALARKRCAGLMPQVEFVKSPAHPLELPDRSIDFVLCQQGFQFFPDRSAAAREIHRVLRDGGSIVGTTWRPVEECRFFGAICDALSEIGEPETSDMMRVPFDRMPESELIAHFESAGFADVRVERQEKGLLVSGGVPHAVELAYATPIGPRLRALPDVRQSLFREMLTDLLRGLSEDAITMGPMVTNVLSARKLP
jgi:ubiquinone/menaquinone biosynthesis C-methylase UbiE